MARTIERHELAWLFNVAFDAKVWAEDAIALEKAGHPHGYKKGVVEKKLKAAEEALRIIDMAMNQGKEST